MGLGGSGKFIFKNFPHFVELEEPLPCLKQPSSFTYPKPGQSSPRPPIHFIEAPF